MTKATDQQIDLYTAGQQVAKLTNVAFALEAMMAVTDAEDTGAPHMAVLFGPPGYGKTQAAMYLAHPQGKNAVFVSVRSFDSTKTLAQLMCLFHCHVKIWMPLTMRVVGSAGIQVGGVMPTDVLGLYRMPAGSLTLILSFASLGVAV